MTTKMRRMSIDDSPILKLPSPERKALREAGDPAFRSFWAECFSAVMPHVESDETLQQQALLRLDALDQTGTPLGETIADTTASPTAHLESTEPLGWLHQGIALMSLAEKEQYGKHSGPLWSSVILSFLRGSIELPLDEALIAERLANCDDLRSLEADNCLWDILLLRSYVAFCLQPPYAPDELEHAALNPVMDENFPPQQDKTVAKFLGVSKAAISQRRKTWSRSILNMKNAQEEP